MSGHGWEKVLLPRALRLIQECEGVKNLQPVEFRQDLAWPFDVSKASQASENHKAEAWASELLRSVLHGTPEQLATSAEVVLSGYVPRDLKEGPRGVGLWSHETGCPDTHGGQHLAGVGLLIVAALTAQDLGLPLAPALMTGARRLLEADAAFLLSVATPSLEVWMPGVRSPGWG